MVDFMGSISRSVNMPVTGTRFMTIPHDGCFRCPDFCSNHQLGDLQMFAINNFA